MYDENDVAFMDYKVAVYKFADYSKWMPSVYRLHLTKEMVVKAMRLAADRIENEEEPEKQPVTW